MIYRDTLKVELHLVLQANKPLDKETKDTLLLELEAGLNSGHLPHAITIPDKGLHITVGMRFHFKDR